MSAPYILVIDDEPEICSLVSDILEDEKYQVETAASGKEARKALLEHRPDLILLDIWMPDIDGISLLKEWVENGELPAPVIMMSGHGNVETAVEATRLGAYDYLEKPLSLAKLLLTVERALENAQIKKENIGLKKQGLHSIEPIGHSAIIQRLKEQFKRVAQHDTGVLITGEPGSGKETYARYLHAQSNRKDRPFIEVSVAAISKGNSPRELFGSEHKDTVHYGCLEEALGGVLFIDEVADMDLETQAQMVGALDTNSFYRIDGSEPVKIDVRIIAATRKNLEEEVQKGTFREDLFFHLNVVPLNIPPLREHHEDVPELLNYYIDFFVTHEKLPWRKFSLSAQNYLRNYSWPGNIRELKNLVQRLLILGAGEEISQEETKSSLGNKQTGEIIAADGLEISLDQPLRKAREEFEGLYLEHQLNKHLGNVSKMAKEVGMERTHLYRKLRSLNIEIKDRR